jgi:pentatricopeptide repeat protein
LPSIGALYLKTGKLDEGLKAFERYVQIVPLAPEAWEQFAAVYDTVIQAYSEAGKKEMVSVLYNRMLAERNKIDDINNGKVIPMELTKKTKDIFEKYDNLIGKK